MNNKKRKPSPKPDDKGQSQRFVEAARKLGVASEKKFSDVCDIIVGKPTKRKNVDHDAPKSGKE